MQFQALVDECTKHGVALGTKKYTAFREYPGEELLDLLVATAQGVWPNLPIKEALRRVGKIAFPTLFNSLIGKVVFGALSRDVTSIWKVLPKGYSVSSNVGSAQLLELHPTEVLVRMEGIYAFVDSWHVGMFEGAIELYGSTPDIFIKVMSANSADFHITWIEP